MCRPVLPNKKIYIWNFQLIRRNFHVNIYDKEKAGKRNFRKGQLLM